MKISLKQLFNIIKNEKIDERYVIINIDKNEFMCTTDDKEDGVEYMEEIRRDCGEWLEMIDLNKKIKAEWWYYVITKEEIEKERKKKQQEGEQNGK